jgi:hypothetical protein
VKYLPIFPVSEARTVPSTREAIISVPVLDNAGD